MAACPTCYATLRGDESRCGRCGHALDGAAPASQRATITPSTSSTGSSAEIGDQASTPQPASAPPARPTAPPAEPTAPPAEPTAPPAGTPWQAPGTAPLGPAAGAAPPWPAPPSPGSGHPHIPTAGPRPEYGYAPVSPGTSREPNPDHSNVIVLVVISALVIAFIIGLAVLASSGAGPALELERAITSPLQPIEGVHLRGR